jgi:hypothetical protein
MDINLIIQNLYAEKERLQNLIAALEELTGTGKPIRPSARRGTRGRKSMGAREREQVSARMRDYWAGRRQAKSAASERPPSRGVAIGHAIS